MSDARLRAFLDGLGLSEFFDALAAERIELDDLALLSEQDLVALGLPLGPRRRLMRSIETGVEQQPSPPAGERRNLTVLFADMVGSTATASQLDPEDLRTRFRAYHETCTAVIEAESGFVAHHLGDGLMAHFGFPRALEDAAIRAVRAGLELIDRVGDLNVPGGSIAVRVGVASGLTVIEEARSGFVAEDEMATGATLALAARLQALAKPGHLVVSDATRRLLRNAFDLQSLGQKSLKGFAEPESVWLAKRRTRPGPPVATEEAVSGQLLGREAEHAELLSGWRDALYGAGRAIVLEGDPGIGKSRLVTELRSAALPDADVVTLHCSSYRHGAALHPVTDWLKAMAAQGGADETDTTLSDVPGVSEESLPLIAEIIGEEPEKANHDADPFKRQDAITDAVIALLAPPTGCARLLIVEDTHWADAATLDVLDRLAERAHDLPLLVVATTRPTSEHRPWGAGFDKLALGPLPSAATEALIAVQAGADNLTEAVRRTITERSGGVPFFAEELTRAVLESPCADSALVPITLQDTLMARLDRLDAGRSVARLGALLGRSFSFELLESCSDMPGARLQEGLSELVAADLLEAASDGSQTYDFRHALVRDVAYDSLLRSRRIDLHRRAARAFETHFPALAAAQPEAVAHHYTEAGDFAEALPHWERAAERAMSQAAPTSAISYCTRALDLLKRLPASTERDAQEYNLRIKLKMPLSVTRGFASDEIEDNLSRMAELLEVTEPTEGALQLLWSRAMSALVRADLVTAKTTALHMLRATEKARLPNAIRMPERILGYVAMLEGELDTAETYFGRVLADYAPKKFDPILTGHPFDVLASTLAQRTILMALRDRTDAVDEGQTLALDRARALGSPATLFQVLVHLCLARFELGDHDGVLPLLVELREVVDRNEFAPLYTDLWEGWAEAYSGDLEEGLAAMERAKEKGMQYPLWRPSGLMLRAGLLANAHRHEEALAVLDVCDSDIARLRHSYLLAEVKRRRASSLAALGAPETEVETLLREAADIAGKQNARRFEVAARKDLARLRLERESGPIADADAPKDPVGTIPNARPPS